MRIARTLILGAICTLASLLVPAESHALFHISAIDEVLASLDGDPNQQFVEIEMLFGAQNLVSNAVIAAFDANGNYIEDILVIPTDLANGTNGARWIVATSEFQSAHSFTADFTMPARIPLGGGMVCWGAPVQNFLPPKDPTSWDHTVPTNYVDCLAYGTYSGPSNRFVGTPTSLVAEGHSLVRGSETDDNAADFSCADVATPTNNSGETVNVPASAPCAAVRASGIQVTPDQKGVLVNKDVQDQRWTITRNLGDLTVTGNVFASGGGAPLFLFCEQQSQSGSDLELRCSGADACSDTACPEFAFIANVTLPLSFFTPPTNAAAVGELIRDAVLQAGSGSTAGTVDGPSGLAARSSGIQITPDQQRVLINKDVQDQRWSITRNLADATVTGNVFLPGGGDPLFLFCTEQSQGGEVALHCSSAASCSDTSCPAFDFIADVTLPESFFAVPGAQPTPQGSPDPTTTPGVTATPDPGPSDSPQPTDTPEPTDSPGPSPSPAPTATPYYPYP